MHLTWLDSNSWLIELGGKRILLDPWLVGPLVFGDLPWLFSSSRQQDRAIPADIDLLLLSQGLEDHAHPPTLKHLDRSIPVVASPNAAKVVQSLGYHQITPLSPTDTLSLGSLEIQAVPGSPIGPTLVENGYLLRDRANGESLYYEPHGYHSEVLKQQAPVDVVITPLTDLRLLLLPFIRGRSQALKVAQWLQPQVMLPTAAGGDISFSGLLTKALQPAGSLEELRALLAQHQLSTQIIEAKPGERFQVPLAPRTVKTEPVV